MFLAIVVPKNVDVFCTAPQLNMSISFLWVSHHFSLLEPTSQVKLMCKRVLESNH